MPEPTDALRSRNRRLLLGMAAMFFVPVAVAFYLYYGLGWKPSAGTNHGELLQPIKQMPESTESLRGKWTMFYVGDGACAEDCRHALWVARQTHISLNKDIPRIHRALFATSNCCDRAFLDKEHEGIHIFDITDPAAQAALLVVLPQDGLANSIFIADPLGNLVLRFDARTDPRGLLEDMKKLLKLSSIG